MAIVIFICFLLRYFCRFQVFLAFSITFCSWHTVPFLLLFFLDKILHILFFFGIANFWKGDFTDKLLWAFFDLFQNLIIVILKFKSGNKVGRSSLIILIATQDDLVDISMKLGYFSISLLSYLILDRFQVHRLINNIMIVRNSLDLWANWVSKHFRGLMWAESVQNV